MNRNERRFNTAEDREKFLKVSGLEHDNTIKLWDIPSPLKGNINNRTYGVTFWGDVKC